ncbi:MAG: RNA methyltransferase [Nitrospirota bacterium]
MNKTLFDNISIILVDTKTPANIGATARCMMNMGLSRLILVNPPKDPLHEAEKLAAGADVILKQALIIPTLKEAIADCSLVFGISRHKGRLRKNICTPRQAAESLASLLSKNKVALVFGNEVNGLTREDLSLCHEFISIPASDQFPSLNLSHAVMIVVYELYLACKNPIATNTEKLAPSKTIEDFYQHLKKTLLNIKFFDQDDPKPILFALRQLFGRSRLTLRDVAILRGILNTVDRVKEREK